MDSAGKAAIRPRTSAAELCFLGREADWLADKLIYQKPNGKYVGAPCADDFGYRQFPTREEAVASWREAARKAVRWE